MALNFSALIAELQKVENNAPAFLNGLNDLLDKLDSEAATVLPALTPYFPGLATLEPKALAEAKTIIAFLLKLEATTLPVLDQILRFLSAIFPPVPA